jgi:hypothetical protein
VREVKRDIFGPKESPYETPTSKQVLQQVKHTRYNTLTTKYRLKRAFGESDMVVLEEKHKLTWL